MKHKLVLSVVPMLCLLVLFGVVVALQHRPVTLSPTGGGLQPMAPAPLDTSDSVPIGLIGTVTVLGTSTVTIEGQPPGNTTPVTLTVLVDAKTSIIKVGPAPVYATSTDTFADFKKGMLLNISATAIVGGVRHADRVVIPPATSPGAPSAAPVPVLPTPPQAPAGQ